MEMSAFCNLYATYNAILFNDAYDRNIVNFDSVVANFRYELFDKRLPQSELYSH